MKAAIQRVLVLKPAVLAHLETVHSRVAPVIRHVPDDRETGATVRAVRERVPVAPVVLVEDVRQTGVAGGYVGRHELPLRRVEAALENGEA